MRIQLRHINGIVKSTQAYARARSGQLEPGILQVYSANGQENGEGTQGRTWFSPAGLNLYTTFSFLLPSGLDMNAFHLGQTASLGVAKLLAANGCPPYFKWPNDLLSTTNMRKYAGVLTEFEGPAAHIGIGVNVNMQTADIPSDLANTVTSLRIATKQRFDLDALLDALVSHVNHALDRLINLGFGNIADEINDFIRQTPPHSQHLDNHPHGRPSAKTQESTTRRGASGETLFDTLPPEQFTGHAVGINNQGHLIFRTTDGQEVECESGRLRIDPTPQKDLEYDSRSILQGSPS